jgi:hypothetical protein
MATSPVLAHTELVAPAQSVGAPRLRLHVAPLPAHFTVGFAPWQSPEQLVPVQDDAA